MNLKIKLNKKLVESLTREIIKEEKAKRMLKENQASFDTLKPGMMVHPANHPNNLMTVIVVKDPELHKVRLKGKDGKEYHFDPQDLVISSEGTNEGVMSENVIQDIMNTLTDPSALPAIIATLGLGSAAVATAKQALKDPEKFKQDLKSNMQGPKGIGPKGGM